MSYTHRSKFNYQQYYFQVIMPDLKNIFFSMQNPNLYNAFQRYKKKYGDSAYIYALKSFPEWKSGGKAISTQTMYRLLEILPPFLSTRQRAYLLEKIINRYVYTCSLSFSNTNKNSKFYNLTWDNYSQNLNALILNLQKKLYSLSPKLYQSLPKVIIDSAAWVCDDDMLIVQRILNDCYAARVRSKYMAAINDVKFFWSKCNDLKNNDAVYGYVSQKIQTPDIIYYIDILPKEKTFSQKVKEFFGG